jgi:hypothetical protein
MVPEKIRKLGDYIPMVLISLLFIAEKELSNHALNVSLQLALTIFIIIVFFTILYQCQSKKMAIIVSFIVWIFLIYIKGVYIK